MNNSINETLNYNDTTNGSEDNKLLGGSFNFYPQSLCKPEDGIVYLALGLGKSIVDGGSSYAFCPEKPKAPLFWNIKAFYEIFSINFLFIKFEICL
jgi:hypothetical protein